MESLKKFWRQFEFTVQEAISNFFRSGWMSGVVITTMVASLSIFGGFWLLLNDFSYFTESIGARLQIVIFLKKEANIDTVSEQVSGIKGVVNVEKISRESAWKDLKRDLEDSIDLGNINNENPLPDTIQINVKGPEHLDYVSESVKQYPEVEEIKYSKELSDYLTDLSRLIRVVGFAITAALSLATLAIIVNTIRLAVNHRKNEIEIMRLVGATNWFIRLPFLLEGIFFGFCSAFFTSIILTVWRTFSVSQVKKLFPFVPVSEDPAIMWRVIIYTMLISIIIGFLGSAFSVHRYLSFERAKAEE